MYGKKGSWLAAAGFYVSMEYRADKMYEKIMERDDHPYKIGYKESQKKLGLCHKNKKSYRAFLNRRNMGGQPVAERVRRGPVLYAQILEGDGRYGRGLNRGIIQEQRGLVKVGVNYCIFVISGNILAGELMFGPARCMVCGKTLAEFGPTCNDMCQKVYHINKTARDKDESLFRSLKDAQPTSDVLSEDEIFTIGFLCGYMTDKTAKKTFRAAERAKHHGDCPFCAMEKYHDTYRDHIH